MKKLIVSIVMLFGLSGAVNAEPLTGVIFYSMFAGTMWLGGAESDQKSDPRLFKTVLAQRVGETGYNFELTQYEYDQSPSKYVIVK